jgi:site-specific recombinase XerD
MATEQRLPDYLTRDEVTSLLRAAKKGRRGTRNHAMILIAYRHGSRERTQALRSLPANARAVIS